MRNTTALLAPLLLALALPAIAAKLVDAPPPPPMPDGPLEEDGLPQKNAASGIMSLGQALYESNCTNCHESVTRVSTRRTMRSLQELRDQVGRWAVVAKLQWNKEEVEEVVRFLDNRHYRF